MAVSDETHSQETPERDPLLSQLLEEDVDLELAFDRLLDVQPAEARGDVVLQSRLPGDCLASDRHSLATLLSSVLAEYQDIEALIEGLRENEGLRDGTGSEPQTREDAVAVVSEEELSNPEALSRALEPLQERDRFEKLFEVAKGALDELDIYELSRKSPNEVVTILRDGGNLRTVQSSVDFLRSLNSAADTFETMDLPHPHIRDYLRHLYLMRDWSEMSRLVGLLEMAVFGLHDAPAGAGRESESP